MMEIQKKLGTSDTFQIGDVLKLISGQKELLGVYIDDGDVVYTETLDIPDDVLFLRRFYYQLYPQLVTLGSLFDFEKVVLQKRSLVQDSFRIAERATYEVGRTTHFNNIEFVEYCCRKNKMITSLVPAILTASAVVLQRKNIDTMAAVFFKDYFTVIGRVIFGYLAYVTLSTVKDLALTVLQKK